MTPRPALGSELPGYLSSLRRGLSALLGRDGPELAEVGADLRELAGLLGARPAGAPSADPWAGLRADLAALRSTVDRVDLLAARVQDRAASVAGTAPSSRADASVEQRLRAAERLLDDVGGARDVADDPRPPEPPPHPGPAVPTPTGEHLMRVVDRLGGAVDTRPEPDPLLRWLHRQLVDLLDAEGITLIEDDGPFDPARHEIIDTRPADDPAQADRISATVRPGYQHRETVLRPQQVVVWRAR